MSRSFFVDSLLDLTTTSVKNNESNDPKEVHNDKEVRQTKKAFERFLSVKINASGNEAVAYHANHRYLHQSLSEHSIDSFNYDKGKPKLKS